ncbi:MAG TPA: aminotransferase class V-fold PLP-dependent enzyme, partial [Candidatus Limnocylindrales bacterium]|nr:aminotransferase class V-fold PLP-dependent enzyme [Candidatus Limnocylindrales bacterium]
MPSDLAGQWALDPAVAFLNHGSFGACPRPVLEAQRAWRDRMEAQPVQFFARDLPGLLAAARRDLGAFVGADRNDLAFVANATGAVNAVVRSLRFAPGDELLTDDHEYNATINVLRHVAERDGARVVVATIPFPVASEDAVADAILGAATDRTRLALVSHVTSPTALVFPIERIVAGLAERGVETLVDGAHAPGMLALDLERIGAAWYTGNLHKWVCAPKGAAFLHARRDRQPGIRPNTISHGANEIIGADRVDGRTRYRAEFDWQGTLDPTAWLAVSEALRFVGGLVDGGWPEVMARNRAMTLRTRVAMTAVLGLDDAVPAPESMLGSLVALPLPAFGPLAARGSGSSPLDTDPLQQRLIEEFQVEVPIYPWPVPAAESPQASRRLIRVSSALHNGPDDVECLVAALGA